MDRIEYLTSVANNNKDKSSEYIVQYFDQLMALYNLTTGCDYTIHISNDCNNNLCVELEFTDPNNCQMVLNKLRNTPMADIYGKHYSIPASTYSSTTITITMFEYVLY